LTIYVDTSVIVASLTVEVHSDRVHQWLLENNHIDMAISPWVVAEMASALALKVRTGQLGLADRDTRAALFTQLCNESFVMLPVPAVAFDRAAAFASQHEFGLRAGDALHLAIASTHRVTIATLDRRMADAANAFGIGAGLT